VANPAFKKTRRVRHAAKNIGTFYHGVGSFDINGNACGNAQTEHQEVIWQDTEKQFRKS
jgi:hypothetical protein